VGKLDGKVAFITGVARGQGRAHAITLAGEGANIIGIDICKDIESSHVPLATEADLDKTVELVEDAGGKMLATVADVRNLAAVTQAARAGFDRFGRLDIVLANAGLMAHQLPPFEQSEMAWSDTIAVNLTGVWHTLQATAPLIVEGNNGGSIVITGSTTTLNNYTTFDGGYDAYQAAKSGILGLMRGYAARLAAHRIRVNVILPTAVDTPMGNNEYLQQWYNSDPRIAERFVHALPGTLVDPMELSQSVLYLVSDAGRFITGAVIPLDLGATTVTFGTPTWA
jgi:SDR family mycofactocin-dependent oxidoreductase